LIEKVKVHFLVKQQKKQNIRILIEILPIFNRSATDGGGVIVLYLSENRSKLK
jgi:hypothetical protein